MTYWRPILLLMLFMAAAAMPAAAADEAEKAFKQARQAYESLLDAPKQKLYRDNWMKVIDRLLAVAEKYPRHRRAPEALYLAARAGQGLYAVSRVDADARQAAGWYEAVTRDFPESSLAEEALMRAAGIAEGLGDMARAYSRYGEVVKRYPKGKQSAEAARKLGALARHAPPKEAEKKAASAPPPPSATAASAASASGIQLTGIRFWSNPGYTRVVLDLSAKADYAASLLAGDAGSGSSARLYIDLPGAVATAGVPGTTAVDDGLLRRIRTGQTGPDLARVVLDLVSFRDYKVFSLSDPFRVVIDIAGEHTTELKGAPAQVVAAPPPPSPPADGIARILDQVPEERPPKVHIPSRNGQGGLRRIVVDAGHGGKDPGAIGPNGVQEKEVTLSLAKALAKRLEEELGCEVVLTRSTDVFLPLEERTAIANKVDADLFISIHANASPNRNAAGIETYYLNFSKNDKAAAVVARENGTSLKQVGDLELILFDLMANSKINESSHLASEIQKSLIDLLSRHYPDIRDLGVKQGPFYVLLGATMPSVLVEVAFISNQREEVRLTDRKYHERTINAITQGVRNYAAALKLIASR
jgi:N-acetylmuramoyl-L-alanine amidase